MTSFYKNVEFLKIVIFINFWFHDFKIFFSSHILFSFCQRDVLNLIIINVFEIHEKSVNKDESILVFLLFLEQNFFCLLCLFFYCKKTLIFFVEILFVLTECWRDLEHKNMIDNQCVLTIEFINLLSNLFFKCFQWNNYFKRLVFEKMFEFCVSALSWLRVIDEIIIDSTFLLSVYNCRLFKKWKSNNV